MSSLKSILTKSAIMASNLLIASLTFATAAQAVTYHIDELPPATGFAVSYARSINDKGVVVGDSHPFAANYFTASATIWRNLTPASLGKVPKGQYSYATAINLTGKIAGDGDNGNDRPIAILFQNNSARFITNGANNSHAIFVGNNGFIIGNYVKGFGPAGWFPVTWTEDPKKPGVYKEQFLQKYIDPAGVASMNFLYDANNKGQAVGYVNSLSIGQQASFWNNDAKHSLKILPGGGYANGINDNGVIVGSTFDGTGHTKPVIWGADTNHTVSDLPVMPGEVYASAIKINNLNQIIGTHGDYTLVGDDGGSLASPAVWINGQIFDLQQSLDSSAFGWQLQMVEDINNLGQIVGSGLFNGKVRGFVLTPIVQP